MKVSTSGKRAKWLPERIEGETQEAFGARLNAASMAEYKRQLEKIAGKNTAARNALAAL